MKNILIEHTASTVEHLGSNFYYVRHIFNFLREHKALLENPDYKRLYDEAIDYLFRHGVKFCDWEESEREWGYSMLEFLADLSNSKGDTEKYSIETVDFFLGERRKIWNE